MKISELQKSIHKNAVAHGWWTTPRPFPEIVALCHSELSEALEEYRDGKPMTYTACTGCQYEPATNVNCVMGDCPHFHESDKPEGIAVEMADTIIRILDWAESEGIDMGAVIDWKTDYNTTRPYRHGGKVI